jgi:uncharacterized membrane protein YoaT (DUF817 family)
MLKNHDLEHRLGNWAREKIPSLALEAVLFVLKQGWAALFGGLLLAAILLSKSIWQPDWPIARYDALFVFALGTQIVFLVFRLESLAEARVILLFHVTGTAMEIFKIHMGSWAYPEPGLFKLMGVPLFSGFMYAAVGSFMARVIRGFHMEFAPYPPLWLTWAFAGAIYVNFFAHHFFPDIRILLFLGSIALFGRTRIWFYIDQTPYWMPLPLAAFLSSFFLWLAENIGTITGTWIYAGQSVREAVSFAKMGSWYLLLYVSFVTVTLVIRDMLHREKIRPAPLNPRR